MCCYLFSSCAWSLAWDQCRTNWIQLYTQWTEGFDQMHQTTVKILWFKGYSVTVAVSELILGSNVCTGWQAACFLWVMSHCTIKVGGKCVTGSFSSRATFLNGDIAQSKLEQRATIGRRCFIHILWVTLFPIYPSVRLDDITFFQCSLELMLCIKPALYGGKRIR